MTITHVSIGSGFWLAPTPAATFAPLQADLQAHMERQIILSTETINGHFYYSGAGRTPAEQAVINPGQIASDHVLGQAIDVFNDPTFRAQNENLFLERMAAHGWHNIDVSGRPFTKEPWHFAWRGTVLSGGDTKPINNKESDDNMRVQNFKLGDQDFFYYPDGTLFHSPDGPHTANLQNWLEVNQLGAFNEAQVNILFSGNSKLKFADAFALPQGDQIKKS